MRIDVKKFLFIGLQYQQELFFKEAQRAGIIHFIDKSPTPYKAFSEEVDRVISAIKVVRELPVMEQEEGVDFDRADEIVERVLKLRETIDKREENVRVLSLEIARVAVFGDFSPDDIAYIEAEGRRKVQFFCAAHGVVNAADTPELVYVGTDFGLDYFVAINKQQTQYPNLVEMKIDKPVGELSSQLHKVQQERREAEDTLKRYAKYEDFLHDVLKLKLNNSSLAQTQTYVERPLDESLFSVTGWVPSTKMADLHRLLQELSIYSERIAIEPWDTIPTYLENTGASRLGEDLVHIYDTPSSEDKDPSLWVLCFFALFFAMIVGDGGYGLVFLGIALYLRFKYTHVKGATKRFFNLFAILAVACMMWGVTNASFFGISLSVDNPMRNVSLISWLVGKKADYHLNAKDTVQQFWQKKYPELEHIYSAEDFLRLHTDKAGYDVLAKFSDQVFLELVLVVAVIHVILSMLRYLSRNWSGVGWILFLIGAFLYLPHTFLDTITFGQYVLHMDAAKAAEAGLYLICIGFSLAIGLGVLQNGLLGLSEIPQVIQVFADIMSYLRLYALGLAGSIVAGTLNEMAAGLPFVLGGILILVGHTVNMLLAIAGGVIHGLRLNFLEWYHYSFYGGGKPFQPLHLLEISSANKQN